MEKINKAENRFKDFLESAPDAIVIVDEDGIIQFVNHQTEQLFGYTREDIIGKDVEVLMPSKY
jgi:protein-histidine pros-kinase